MGNYDYIQIPTPGIPLSSSLFGGRVRDSIIDLDRRLSAYDASTGVGKAYSVGDLSLANTTETTALVISGFRFRAGYAYKLRFKATVIAGNAVTQNCQFRIRKGSSATPSSLTDWGGFDRWSVNQTGVGFGAMSETFLIRNDTTDLVSDVTLSAAASAATITVRGTTQTPRYFTIEPAGFATDFVGIGMAVT